MPSNDKPPAYPMYKGNPPPKTNQKASSRPNRTGGGVGTFTPKPTLALPPTTTTTTCPPCQFGDYAQNYGGQWYIFNDGIILPCQTLTIPQGQTVIFYGTITIQGTLINNGTIIIGDSIDTQSLVNAPGGTINNYGAIKIISLSTLNNYGTINNSSSSITNTGRLLNVGTITNPSGSQIINNGNFTSSDNLSSCNNFENAGTIINNGVLTNSANSFFVNDPVDLGGQPPHPSTIKNGPGGVFTNAGMFVTNTPTTPFASNGPFANNGGTYSNNGNVYRFYDLSQSQAFNSQYLTNP